jgi:hypothetical protein
MCRAPTGGWRSQQAGPARLPPAACPLHMGAGACAARCAGAPPAGGGRRPQHPQAPRCRAGRRAEGSPARSPRQLRLLPAPPQARTRKCGCGSCSRTARPRSWWPRTAGTRTACRAWRPARTAAGCAARAGTGRCSSAGQVRGASGPCRLSLPRAPLCRRAASCCSTAAGSCPGHQGKGLPAPAHPHAGLRRRRRVQPAQEAGGAALAAAGLPGGQ